MGNVVLCIVALQGFLVGGSVDVVEDRYLDSYQSRMDTCLSLADEADRQSVPVPLVLAVAWVESKFYDKAVSSAGAIGPMQILPQFHCPGKREEGCDLIARGVEALRKYLSKYSTVEKALCHYNAGNVCGKTGKRYAKRVRVLRYKLDVASATLASLER